MQGNKRRDKQVRKNGIASLGAGRGDLPNLNHADNGGGTYFWKVGCILVKCLAYLVDTREFFFFGCEARGARKSRHAEKKLSILRKPYSRIDDN